MARWSVVLKSESFRFSLHLFPSTGIVSACSLLWAVRKLKMNKSSAFSPLHTVHHGMLLHKDNEAVELINYLLHLKWRI